MLTESLTVSITADSADLEAELTRLSGRIAGFSAELAAIGEAAGAAGAAIATLAEAADPLARLSGIVTGLSAQLTAIASTPLTIDVSPAVAALQQVISTALMAAAAVSSIGGGFGGSPGGGLGGIPGGGFGGAAPSLPRLASGGRVDGPGGVDRVPAMLTRGEFVIREAAARRFPDGLLDRLNASGPAALPPTSIHVSAPAAASGSSPMSPESAPVQMLGDITVQVTQPIEIDEVFRQLELGRLRQQTRFG